MIGRSNSKKKVLKREKEKRESKCQICKNIDHNFRWFSGQMGAFGGLLAILNSKNRHDDRSWSGRVMRGRIGDTFNKPPADDSQEINRESIREGRPRENYVVAWYISHSPWINVSPILPRCIKSLQPFSHQTLPKNWPALMHWEQTVAWVRVADEMYRFVLVACSYAITYTFFLFHPQFDARLWKKLNEHSHRCRVDVPRRCANKTSTTRLISQGTIIISADRCPIPDVLLSTWFASIETRHATPIDTQMYQNCYISMCQCNKFYSDIILICEDIVIEVLFKIRTYRSIANIF